MLHSPVVLSVLSCLAVPLVSQDRPKSAEASAKEARVESATDLYAFENLLRIELTMKPQDWDKVRKQKRRIGGDPAEGESVGFTYQRCDIRINGEFLASVGVRKKGFIGSISSQRPSLKIKMHEYVKGQSFAGVKRLTLNNNQQDDSQVRQYLSYKWFRSAGVAAPRCNFARLFVNGKYLGIYSNVEPVRKSLLREQLGSGKGTLYEGTAADFTKFGIESFDTKTNKKKDRREELRKVVAILDSKGEGRADKLAQHVDVDQFLAFWAAEVMLGHWDGYAGNRNNFFVYWHPEKSRFVFLPWGTDGSFATMNPFIATRAPRLIRARGRLCSAFFADVDYRKRYFDVFRRMLNDWWKEKEMLAEVDRAVALLEDHVHASPDAFETAVDALKTYIENVTRQLGAELKSPPDKWLVPIERGRRRRPANTQQVSAASTMKSTFRVPMSVFNPKAPRPVRGAKLGIVWRGKEVPFQVVLGVAGYTSKKPPWYESPQVLLVGARGNKGAPVFLSLTLDPEILATGHVFQLDMFDAKAWFGRVGAGGGPAVIGNLSGTARCEIVEVKGKRFFVGSIDAKIRSGVRRL